MGVVIAGSAMGLSVHYASHIPDAVGSIAIGGLLGTVAMFMIRTNAFALVGRSIPEEKIKEINEDLEGDIMVRQIMDVKGIDMGNGIVRWITCFCNNKRPITLPCPWFGGSCSNGILVDFLGSTWDRQRNFLEFRETSQNLSSFR